MLGRLTWFAAKTARMMPVACWWASLHKGVPCRSDSLYLLFTFCHCHQLQYYHNTL